MKKGVIYTCISGKYDNLRDYLVLDKDWDYICFSNFVQRSVYNQSWQLEPLAFDELDDVRNARWHKINPHKLLKKYKYSVWVDANIDIVKEDFYQEIEKHIANSEQFAVMKHPERDCIYDEASVIINAGMDDDVVVTRQMEKIREQKYPEHKGLIASSILFRKHNDREVINVMNEWWEWVRDYSRRDQLSLNFVLWRLGFKPKYLPFVYKNPGQSGPLYWRQHEFISRKISESRESYISSLEALVLDLKNRNHYLEDSVSQLRAEINKLTSSRSWKLTKPLRQILRLLQKVSRKSS